MMLPPVTRVYLGCGFTDMRNYAECLVMRSMQPEASIVTPQPATSLRITTILFDAHRIKEDAHAEFDDAPHGPDLVP